MANPTQPHIRTAVPGEFAELGPTAGEFTRLVGPLQAAAFRRGWTVPAGATEGQPATVAIATPLHAAAAVADHIGGVLTVASLAGGHARPEALAAVDATARMLTAALDINLGDSLEPDVLSARTCARGVLNAIRCVVQEGDHVLARKHLEAVRVELAHLEIMLNIGDIPAEEAAAASRAGAVA